MPQLGKKEFSELSMTEKAELVFTKGEYIGVRNYYNQFINLYLYNDYFVEVWYFPEVNKIRKIDALEDEKVLNLYIDYMNKLKNKEDKL